MLSPAVGVLLRDRVARRTPPRPPRRAGGVVLRTNLSTRPFYNERAVQLLLALPRRCSCWRLTAFNAIRIFSLSRQNTELSSLVNRDRPEAQRLTREAQRIRAGINLKELQATADAAAVANALIDQRTFSWTEFFNRIEETLPPDVMLTSVQPSFGREATVDSDESCSAAQHRGHRRVHGEARGDRRLPRRPADAGGHHRRRTAPPDGAEHLHRNAVRGAEGRPRLKRQSQTPRSPTPPSLPPVRAAPATPPQPAPSPGATPRRARLVVARDEEAQDDD